MEEEIKKNESNISKEEMELMRTKADEEAKEFHNEDINTYAEIYAFTKSIFVYAYSGEDEFTVIAPNKIISNPYFKFLTHNILWYHINNYYYRLSSMINNGTETEVTFTQIKD